MNPSDVPARGFQLVYTNVEAELSPTRQRGAQVWLYSPELGAEQRRAMARLLGDFRLPRGTSPDDPALARHVYARTDDGLVVTARTVPLSEKDKFGRGGRFHAHALVFPDAEFDRLDGDPFRVFDWFSFHNRPDDAMQSAEWRSGVLPAVEVPVGVTQVAAGGPIPPGDKLAALAAHLLGEPGRAVVVADAPVKVLSLFRAFLGVLPPAARRRATFDTLSTGESLGKVWYPLVGGYSPEHLKVWAYRKYVVLDSGSWAVAPGCDGTPDRLPTALLAAPGWVELAEADRSALFRAGEVLANTDLEQFTAIGVSDAARRVLRSCPATGPALVAAIRARFERDVDPELAAIPGVRHAVEELLRAVVKNTPVALARPVEPAAIGAALVAALGQPGAANPGPRAVTALARWVDAHPDPRLGRILARWCGDLGPLSAVLDGDDPEAAADLRGWLESTLPESFRGDPDGRPSLAGLIPFEARPDPAKIRDVTLALLLETPRAKTEADALRLLLAFHRGQEAWEQFAATKPTAAAAFVARQADRFRGGRVGGWRSLGVDGDFIGVWVHPEHEYEARLLAAVPIAVERDPMAAAALVSAFLPELTAPRPRAAGGDPQADPSRTSVGLLEKVRTSGHGKATKAIDAARAHLLEGTDLEFARTANRFLRRPAGAAAAGCDLDPHGWYWFGVEVPPGEKSGGDVFRAVAGAAAPEVLAARTVTDEVAPSDAWFRRVTWLAARLLDPDRTETWTV